MKNQIKESERYIVRLFNSYGCDLAERYSEQPYHPVDWYIESGDIVKVYDRINKEFLPDYYIA